MDIIIGMLLYVQLQTPCSFDTSVHFLCYSRTPDMIAAHTVIKLTAMAVIQIDHSIITR